MSTSNIESITAVMGGTAVAVTFRVHSRQGTATYLYTALDAVKGILAGDDPANWSGVRVDSSSADAANAGASGAGYGASTGFGGALGTDIAEAAEDIGEFL